MARQLPRFEQLEKRLADDERKVAKILAESAEVVPAPTTKGSSNGGHWERLRGLPAIGRGCAGHIRGSDPLGETLRREHRLRRRR